MLGILFPGENKILSNLIFTGAKLDVKPKWILLFLSYCITYVLTYNYKCHIELGQIYVNGNYMLGWRFM